MKLITKSALTSVTASQITAASFDVKTLITVSVPCSIKVDNASLIESTSTNANSLFIISSILFLLFMSRF